MPQSSAQALVERACPQRHPVATDAAATPLPGEWIIDVREPGEFATGHLPDAINIPRGILEFRLDADPALARRDQPILLYCASGGRATLAALSLQQLGYSAVHPLSGGFLGWTAAGGPVAF
ncbi:rhodanese-like domain-containing protein [Xanthomonas theicola]|uniref:Sulfurtransferase n=1 Tax=Xanthomonas theicola TaxID=56464 RepID=A0A2S6ZK23_9XANT|nr:rhodanese-like domain-containing protein [Xanthomonas theicola]PPT92470.1 sulfurtransferase [Xanthomonas theicola]QNH26429.1 rhodanese-like domain-containing protein [Xanthomonas theicola]